MVVLSFRDPQYSASGPGIPGNLFLSRLAAFLDRLEGLGWADVVSVHVLFLVAIAVAPKVEGPVPHDALRRPVFHAVVAHDHQPAAGLQQSRAGLRQNLR